MIIGRACMVDDDVVSGWCLDTDQPVRPRVVEIRLNGGFFARLLACEKLYKQSIAGEARELGFDLEAATEGYRTLACGFSYKISYYVPRGAEHRVLVADVESGQALLDTRTTLTEECQAALRDFFSAYPLVHFGSPSLSGSELTMKGWLSVPEEPIPDLVLLCDEAPFDSFQLFPKLPPEQVLWFAQDRSYADFRGSIDLSRLEPARPFHRINLARPGSTETYFPAPQSYYIPVNWREISTSWPMPSDAGRIRTMGNADPNTYRYGGYTNLRVMEDAIHALTGKRFADFRAILDWGCGCARGTQHLARFAPGAVTGVDIDPENIAWDQAHIPDAAFQTVPLLPPTDLPDAHFELVTGISVFTHLTEEIQFRWLEELHRITKDRGVVAVTIAGLNSFSVGAAGAGHGSLLGGAEPGHLGQQHRKQPGRRAERSGLELLPPDGA